MQPALFRLGAIVATPDFLASVPRPAMVQAIKRHATERRPIRDGQPILSASCLRQHRILPADRRPSGSTRRSDCFMRSDGRRDPSSSPFAIAIGPACCLP